MERDNLFAHGAPNVAKDRMHGQSDAYKMWFCDYCGLPAVVIEGDSTRPTIKKCNLCQTDKISLVDMCYATKLLNQEFGAMGVISRVMTSEFVPQEEEK